MNVTSANTNCIIGTDIGPAVPFSANFATVGAYFPTLNFTTLTMPPPSTVTVMVRYYITMGKVTKECYATIVLPLPNCTGMWQSQRQILPSSQNTSPTGMMVYPNPAQHTMNVNYNYGKNVATDGARRIVVYDLTGKAVFTQAVNDATGTISIPVDALAGAVYMVRMEQNGLTIQIQRVSITH
ncbi:MAG: T9SS type A sorting domain-containing protein [Chitinophagaceae bacterium]